VDYGRFGLPDFKAVPRRDYLLALLSGILLALSYPKPALSALAWFAFLPLFLAIGRKTPKQAFLLGMVTGLTAFGGILYWINIVVTTYGKLPWAVSILVFSLLVAYLALYPAIAACLTRFVEERGVSLFISFPIIWVSLEYIRAWLLTGFPWALLGHTQYRTLPLIQIADITGVYGLSFLIAMANVLFYSLLRAAVSKENRVFPTKEATIFICCLLLTLGYGFYRLNALPGKDTMKVALIQGNIDQSVKWDPAYMLSTVATYEKLSREACVNGADLVVWPESAAPFYFQLEPRMAERLRSLPGELKSCLVFGSPAVEREHGEIRYLNSAFLLSPSGDVLGRSDKLHLVPFGEYVPLARFLPFVHKMVEGIGDFSPGSRLMPLNTGKGEIGILVCFEGIFPELARDYVKAGSRLLVNITNDAWFGRSSAPYQHLSIGVFRAVENRVPLVRAANTGITAVIDSQGHVTGATALFQQAYLNSEIRLGEGRTLYTRFGDVFARLCLIASLAILFSRKSSSSG